MKSSTMVMLLIASLSLSACNLTHEESGTLTGAAIGGLAGSAIGSGSGRAAAIFGGTILGAFIGNRIGASMDEYDRAHMAKALNTTKTGHTSQWVNPDNGNQYTVKPTRTYNRDYQGYSQPCREYTTTAMIGGKQQNIYGTACRTADGDWRIVR